MAARLILDIFEQVAGPRQLETKMPAVVVMIRLNLGDLGWLVAAQLCKLARVPILNLAGFEQMVAGLRKLATPVKLCKLVVVVAAV